MACWVNGFEFESGAHPPVHALLLVEFHMRTVLVPLLFAEESFHHSEKHNQTAPQGSGMLCEDH